MFKSPFGSNCTLLELKHCGCDPSKGYNYCSNCTLLELKPLSTECPYQLT